jgi:hypothetical protein
VCGVILRYWLKESIGFINKVTISCAGILWVRLLGVPMHGVQVVATEAA